MGYSCASRAAYRLDGITAWIIAQSGSSNVWTDPKTGIRYFWEQGRENRDGAITGTIHKFVDDTHCRRSGSFRIEPDGIGFRGPATLKTIPAYLLVVDGYEQGWPTSLGVPTDETLWAHLLGYAKGFEAGGVNAHVSKSLGYVPYPTRAHVIRLNDAKTVVQWQAGAFQVWGG